ncbi:MAG: isocitrate lyase/phosphoenolpyruvate mutase family protein [Anaerolineae bacterium]
MVNVERAQTFKDLHRKGTPLILYNVWDVGTAKAVQQAGAKAIATSSAAVAVANGFSDRQDLPIDLALANLRRIVAAVDLPVTLDFESGYAASPDELGPNIRQVIEAGAVGINFEDQIIGGTGLYSIETQCARIAAVRQAADELSFPLFINARTDLFLKKNVSEHTEALLEEAIERAKAYRLAGASGIFAPGLRRDDLIRTLCDASPLPVNIMIYPDTFAPGQLAACGVSRISYGAVPYGAMVAFLKADAERAFADGN